MKQEELDKVCGTAEEMLKAIQNCVNTRYTRLTDACIKDMAELFRKHITEKCGISD